MNAERLAQHKHRRGRPIFAGRVGEKRREQMEGGTAASTEDVHSDDYR